MYSKGHSGIRLKINICYYYYLALNMNKYAQQSILLSLHKIPFACVLNVLNNTIQYGSMDNV